jgi:hypothetical protein
MPENTTQPQWEERPDGSRMRLHNGIRIIDRTPRGPDPSRIEHLVAQPEAGGRLVILGLDARCKPIYQTTLYGYL